MNQKLELLKEVLGKNFEEIECDGKVNENFFKCENGEAFIIHRESYPYYLMKGFHEYVPYLDNNILRNNLPKKFHNESFLNDLKELSKYNHTLISNFLIDEIGLLISLKESIGYNNLILEDSEVYYKNEYEIYYSEN